MRLSGACIIAALVTGCSGGMNPSTLSQSGGNQAALSIVEGAGYVQQQIASGNFIEACPTVVFGRWRCQALGLRDTSRAPRTQGVRKDSVAGYGPSDLQSAYNITKDAKKPGGLVAVVEAYGDPNLASDLAVYRKEFGLPKCDEHSGCLRIVNQRGKKKPLPPVNDGWLAEQSLDVDMVSANCPNCKILVVEAATNLYTAERTAVKLGAVAVSNSWGSGEYKYERHATKGVFNHPGVAITASAGDGGYGVIYPSAANTVTAIGGTTLRKATGSRGWSETVWGGSGSGCSLYEGTPSWQMSLEKSLGGCSKRIVSDVAYEADPNTGVAVYESIAGDGEPAGWQVWGGTSVGSPAIAAIYALSGDTTGIPASIAYANTQDLYDVTSGSNGSCSPAYLCTGEVGYDGPTGNGTPNGLGAF
jgi:subtilase family serine protease